MLQPASKTQHKIPKATDSGIIIFINGVALKVGK
jgi:hypothetical protein